MCCVSNVGLPVLAGLAVAIGAFGFSAWQPQPASNGATGTCTNATTASNTCCGGTNTASANCCGGCTDAAKAQAVDPRPEPGSAKIGEAAPDFALIDLDGNRHQLSEYTAEGKIVVLEWFNPGCPFVVKHHERFSTMADTFGALVEMTTTDDAPDGNVVWLAINSGAPGKQGADPAANVSAVKEWEIEYPVLMDPTGLVGRAYDARTTPHMYVISGEGTLIYAGAIDNNTSAREAGDINYVLQAVEQHLAGETITNAETRPYGCSVKY